MSFLGASNWRRDCHLDCDVFYACGVKLQPDFSNTDEWNYIQAFGTPTTLLSYLFEQHNDHRIPIQKLLQLSALYVGGFDFRMLVSINMSLLVSLQ